MTEYEIKFSKARQQRGLRCYAVMKLMTRDAAGEVWSAVSEHHSEDDAQAELDELKAKDAR